MQELTNILKVRLMQQNANGVIRWFYEKSLKLSLKISQTLSEAILVSSSLYFFEAMICISQFF
jgi:hypothetical protein